MALTEQQRIAQKLGTFDPVSEWVLKPESEKVAGVLRNAIQKGLGIRDRDNETQQEKEDHEFGPARLARVMQRRMNKDDAERAAKSEGAEKKAAFPPQQFSGGMQGGGMQGGSMPAGMAQQPQHPMMAPPGQMDPAMMMPQVDPVDQENETLEKMIKNVQLKKQLMEEHSAMAAGAQGGQPGGQPGGMMGQMPQPSPQMQSDPMAHLRSAMGAR